MRRGVITLYIDPEAYENEIGVPLTEDMLQEYGKQANEDFAAVFGYEGWEAEFQEVQTQHG